VSSYQDSNVTNTGTFQYSALYQFLCNSFESTPQGNKQHFHVTSPTASPVWQVAVYFLATGKYIRNI